MSDIKTSIQNDNDKDVEKGDIPKQASLDTSTDMHAAQDKTKDIRRSVLHKGEEHTAGRGELNADTKDKLYTFGYNAQPQVQNWYPQQRPGFYEDPGRAHAYQQPPGAPQGYFQGGQDPRYYTGPGQMQQGPWQGPTGQQQQPRRRSEYSSSPVLDYSQGGEDRNEFVRKVMMLLFAMLLVTCAFLLIVVAIPGVRRFFQTFSVAIFIPCMIVLMYMTCIMPTSVCARKSPSNYVCLVIVVIMQSLVCGAITAKYSTHIVLEAFLATLACVALCVILAFSNFDFTKCILYVLVIITALVFLLIIVLVARFVFGVYSKALLIVILFAITIVNVVMLTLELQMVLGGKSIEIGEEDYALAAYLLYTSILELFINLVQVLGLLDSN